MDRGAGRSSEVVKSCPPSWSVGRQGGERCGFFFAIAWIVAFRMRLSGGLTAGFVQGSFESPNGDIDNIWRILEPVVEVAMVLFSTQDVKITSLVCSYTMHSGYRQGSYTQELSTILGAI